MVLMSLNIFLAQNPGRGLGPAHAIVSEHRTQMGARWLLSVTPLKAPIGEEYSSSCVCDGQTRERNIHNVSRRVVIAGLL